MPICPNCEIPIEYKNGMVCDRCTFDFKRYWVIPWTLLNLKFHHENRTTFRLFGICVWMVTPTLLAIALGRFVSELGLAAMFLFDIAVVIPVSVVTFFGPLVAIFKNDCLRTSEQLSRKDMTQ